MQTFEETTPVGVASDAALAPSTDISVAAWHDGRFNFGLRLTRNDRDRFFSRDWRAVRVSCSRLGHPPVEIALRPYFWGICSQLRSRAIRQWFCQLGYITPDYRINRARWPYCTPPKMRLHVIDRQHFDLR